MTYAVALPAQAAATKTMMKLWKKWFATHADHDDVWQLLADELPAPPPLATALASEDARPSADHALAVAEAAWHVGDLEAVEAALRRAHTTDRTQLAPLFDLAELALDRHRFDDAIGWFEAASAADGGARARVGILAARYRQTPSEKGHFDLLDAMESARDAEAAALYWGSVGHYRARIPQPRGAVARRLIRDADALNGDGDVVVASNVPAPPSLYVAIRAELERRGRDAKLVVTLPEAPKRRWRRRAPTPPEPTRLWSDPTQGIPALPRPPAAVADPLNALAQTRYHLDHWWGATADIAAHAPELDDLLAVALWPPPPPSGSHAWDHLRLLQLAVALTIAQHPSRAVSSEGLEALVLGPSDWLVEAGIIAAARAARAERQRIPATADLIRRRLADRPTLGDPAWLEAIGVAAELMRLPAALQAHIRDTLG